MLKVLKELTAKSLEGEVKSKMVLIFMRKKKLINIMLFNVKDINLSLLQS